MTSIYKGAHGVILLFDVHNRASFDSVDDWMKEIKGFAKDNCVIYLVGTKIDAPHRVISSEQGQQMASTLGIKYYEVSAKTSDNVDNLFCKIVNDLKDANALSTSASSRSPSSVYGSSKQDDQILLNSSSHPGKSENNCCCIIQ